MRVNAKVDPKFIDPKFYEASYWLDGSWCAEWIRTLPSGYWRPMLEALIEHWFVWLEPEAISPFLDTPEGKRVVVDQLFLRMSQASETFVPWLEAVCNLKGKKVLEIGGGAGSSTVAMARAGAEVVALDIAQAFLEISRVRARLVGVSAETQVVRGNWLAADHTTTSTLAPFADVDLIVCYALLEHLTLDERLRLLNAVRRMMEAKPSMLFAVWETPNRLAPVDWHTTGAVLPDIVPDELAALYLKRAIPSDHRAAAGGPWTLGEAGRVEWARAGRGVSFHEFAVAFNGGYEVIQDGYWGGTDLQSYYKPNRDWERALEQIFGAMTPPVARGFCRPALNLVLKLRA